MNTGFHFDISSIKKEEDQVDFLIGRLRSAFCTFDITLWRKLLWELTVSVSSNTYGYDNEKKADFIQTV